jgi:V8-like Glu-specific endopeptidase
MHTIISLMLLFGFSLRTYATFFPSQRIIGSNDLSPVSLNFSNQKLIKAIGRMNLGCTVTHIGKGYALTAGHCLNKKQTKTITNQKCSHPKFEIQWGHTQNKRYYLKSKCSRIVVLEHSLLSDYAIIKVNPYPKDIIKVEHLNNISEREFIKILSHPKKRPLESSQECLATYNTKPYKKRWLYECDTESGSSGAVLLNKNNKIIGIHNSYASKINKNSGTHIINTLLFKILQILQEQP